MKSLRYLNKYFIKYKWLFLFGIVFTVISNYFSVQLPVYVQSIMDSFKDLDDVVSVNEVLFLALKVGGIYMLLRVCSGIFLFLMRQTIIIMSRNIEFDLKNEIYKQYQQLDYSFYKKNSTGDLMNRISEDVGLVRMYLGPGIMYTVNLVVLSILVIFQMIMINPMLTLIVLIPLPIMSFLIYIVSSTMNKKSMEVQKEQSMLSTIAQETFAGIRVIKAYNREKEINSKFEASSAEYKKRSLRLVMVNALFMPTIIFLIGLTTILTIYFGGLMHYSGSPTIGGITAFIMYVNMLTWPFASVGWVTSIIQRAAASQERINEFLRIQPTIRNPNPISFDFMGKIEFRNVSYTYPDSGIEAIKNLSFTVNSEETLAIIGRTGSGKSTILNLLMRQVDPDKGQILIDDIDLREINLDSFRSQTGVVPQEVFLFSDTIGNNIRFGSLDPEISDEEIIESTEKAHVLHNINHFPDKFETLLGERGVNLSGGQKQRLSIARALIRKPKLLILDDCLSAVDTETEEIILSNLKKERKSKTTLIVSHRISSLRNADHIVVIDHGEKMEEGTHQELMTLNRLYAEMYTKQLSEEKN